MPNSRRRRTHSMSEAAAEGREVCPSMAAPRRSSPRGCRVRVATVEYRPARPARREAADRCGRRAETRPSPTRRDRSRGRRARLTQRLPDRAGRYPAAVPDRLPSPGPSFLREHEVVVGDHTFRAGMARPSDAPDGWWLTMLWVTDDEGVVSFRDLAPAAGPPPDPPLARLGPAVAGALSGFILEDAGRLQLRLGRDRPARRPDPAVARPGGDPGGLPVRAGARGDDARRTSSRRPCWRRSVAPSRACIGRERTSSFP